MGLKRWQRKSLRKSKKLKKISNSLSTMIALNISLLELMFTLELQMLAITGPISILTEDLTKQKVIQHGYKPKMTPGWNSMTLMSLTTNLNSLMMMSAVMQRFKYLVVMEVLEASTGVESMENLHTCSSMREERRKIWRLLFLKIKYRKKRPKE